MALGMVLSVILRFLNMSFEWLPISVNLDKLTLLTWARPWRTYEIVTAKQGKTKRDKSFVGIVAYLISSTNRLVPTFVCRPTLYMTKLSWDDFKHEALAGSTSLYRTSAVTT